MDKFYVSMIFIIVVIMRYLQVIYVDRSWHYGKRSAKSPA